MQAKLEKKEGVTIIHLSGRIDFESADRFRESSLKILKDQNLIFNLESLSFVGSSGITPFLETINDLYSQNKEGLKFCKVGVEFRKIFEASTLKNAEIFDSLDAARIAFQRPATQFIEKPNEVLANNYLPLEYDIKD